MAQRHMFLKGLAMRMAATWEAAAKASCLEGEARIETKNTNYQFRQGVCVAVSRRGESWNATSTAIVGMKLIGWLSNTDPSAGLTHTWKPGSYAVLWRERGSGAPHSRVAITSATLSFTESSPGSGVHARPQVSAVSPDAPTLTGLSSNGASIGRVHAG